MRLLILMADSEAISADIGIGMFAGVSFVSEETVGAFGFGPGGNVFGIDGVEVVGVLLFLPHDSNRILLYF